ncbi:MAG: UDP-N-acetylmuramoyl-L-alanyl-D-glutamate--2,6-diaminopimelate ligase, partial [Candidatus Omnitrophica bacterium]|nr:UDP-N-acetylmuramoyl-L-alanyl-D-glutamate--2,6-diaminopimelate ligase [Candidatus Omnitrophota bacterium]
VYNILAAICCALSEGVPIEVIRGVISDFKGVEGRLEAVNSNRGFKVFIDYAHTDNALENVLNTLRGVTKNKVIVVFGCGGDRDRSKRPRMGKIASRLADYVIITSDNPRSESPLAIANEIEKGIDRSFKDYKIIPDRFKAIGEAIKRARLGDIVLIAGKGHEKYQVVRDKILPFSDKAIVQKMVSKKGLVEDD